MAPTNVYFDTGTQSEQDLYEAIAIEQIRIQGQEVYYLPRTLVKEDNLFYEDTLSKFDDAYLIEMVFNEVDGFGGEKELMGKFGLEMREECSFTVSRRRFDELVGTDSNIIVSSRPNEGDVIYFPTLNKMFEITFVDHDDPFYQVQNRPTYRLSCRTFEYSSEIIDTDIAEIDAVETTFTRDSMQYQVSMEQSGTYTESFLLEDSTGGENLILDGTDGSSTNADSDIQGESEYLSGAILAEDTEQSRIDFYDNFGLSFIVDERIVGASSGAIGYVLDILDPMAYTLITSTEFTDGETFTGQTSQTTAKIKELIGTKHYIVKEDYIVGDQSSDYKAQNEYIDTLDDSIFDFSESNPFSEGGL